MFGPIIAPFSIPNQDYPLVLSVAIWTCGLLLAWVISVFQKVSEQDKLRKSIARIILPFPNHFGECYAWAKKSYERNPKLGLSERDWQIYYFDQLTFRQIFEETLKDPFREINSWQEHQAKELAKPPTQQSIAESYRRRYAA